MRHYDVQIMGGILLHRGEIVEMRTGEGKTLVVTLPFYLNALTGKGVQLVTVNEYLARRDGGWMGNIYHLLGLTTGCIGPQQFSALYDPDYVNPGAELEDERLVHWRPCTRQQAYQADITYGISSEFGFDYLRDNMVTNREQLVQREHNYAVIDEVDNVLIDEARTPLIISGPAPRSGKEYARFSGYRARPASQTRPKKKRNPTAITISTKKAAVISLTEMGIAEIEKRIPEIDRDAGDSLYDPRFYQLTYYLDNALKAQYMFKQDVQYVVQNGEVIIVDDFTGRLMPGRRYSDGLHEAIEAKEGVTIQTRNDHRRHHHPAKLLPPVRQIGRHDRYGPHRRRGVRQNLRIGRNPPADQCAVHRRQSGNRLVTDRQKVENAEPCATWTPRPISRCSSSALITRTRSMARPKPKITRWSMRSSACICHGRPVLVGTTSVEHSEIIHRMLKQEKIKHTVLNAKIHQSEALIVAQAGRKGAVTISTNMAGRGTDILLGGNPEGLTAEMAGKGIV